MFTVQKILALPDFSYLTLLNSNAELTREINTVETTETPDVADYLPKNTFLLTTGMAFQNDPEAFCDFIRSLDELPIAGLGIKHGRYIDRLDPSIIEYADSLGFPLIHIPEEQTLGTVSHHLLSYLWNNQSGSMELALNLQKHFSEMMLNGASVENLVKYLGSALKIPILLEDPFFNLIATSHHFNGDSKYMLQFNKDYESFLKNKLIEYSRTKNKKNLENDNYYIYPIKLDSFFNYYLILMKDDKKAFPLSSLMIEQASIVLSHTIYKNMKLLEKNIDSNKVFFDRLININQKRSDKSVDLLEYGNEFGLIDSEFYRISICQFYLQDTTKSYADKESIQFNLIFDWFKNEMKQYNENIILFPINLKNGFGMLMQSEISNLETILNRMKQKLDLEKQFNFHFFIGSPVFSPYNIHYSYKEAMEIFTSLQNDALDPQLINYYETTGVEGIIKYVPEHVKRHFCLVNLKELAYPEEEAMKDLRYTLKVFLDSQSEIKLTSERLFVHRNTVKYRIAKCKDLLNSSLDGSEDTLNLRMALIMSEQTQEIR